MQFGECDEEEGDDAPTDRDDNSTSAGQKNETSSCSRWGSHFEKTVLYLRVWHRTRPTGFLLFEGEQTGTQRMQLLLVFPSISNRPNIGDKVALAVGGQRKDHSVGLDGSRQIVAKISQGDMSRNSWYTPWTHKDHYQHNKWTHELHFLSRWTSRALWTNGRLCCRPFTASRIPATTTSNRNNSNKQHNGDNIQSIDDVREPPHALGYCLYWCAEFDELVIHVKNAVKNRKWGH